MMGTTSLLMLWKLSMESLWMRTSQMGSARRSYKVSRHRTSLQLWCIRAVSIVNVLSSQTAFSSIYRWLTSRSMIIMCICHQVLLLPLVTLLTWLWWSMGRSSRTSASSLPPDDGASSKNKQLGVRAKINGSLGCIAWRATQNCHPFG